MKLKAALAASAAMGACLMASPAQAGTDAYLGEMMMTGATYCPRAYSETNGQLLSIAQNTALFSLMGTTYGGDGRTTFALPDFRGRVPMHYGTGPGLTTRNIGERSGSELNYLTVSQMPSHNHTALLMGEAQVTADKSNPTGNTLARGATIYATTAPDPANALNPASIVVGNNGGNQPVNNMQPYLVTRFCIATQGIFPPRS